MYAISSWYLLHRQCIWRYFQILYEYISAISYLPKSNPRPVTGWSESVTPNLSQRSAVTSVPTSTFQAVGRNPLQLLIFLSQTFRLILSSRQATRVVGNEILLKLSLVRVSITLGHVVDFHARGLTTVTAILGLSFPSLSSSAIPTHTLHMFSLATSFLALTRHKAPCSPPVSF
jgi:hypothetical protein